MVKAIRNVEKIKGCVNYEITDNERNKRRSLYARMDISIGDTFTESNVGSYRPGFGLSPRYWEQLEGKVSKRNIKKGDILTAFDLK